MKTILKVDIDLKMNKRLFNNYIITRKAVLRCLGFKVLDVVHHPSSKRGYHFWFHCNGKQISDKQKNEIQWLLLDDTGRFLINAMRIKRGIDWDRGNKLFSRVLKRTPIDKKCEKCRIHKFMINAQKEVARE